ncbi:DUF305 domain-containing protein [Brevundimonas vesicularis]|uniref:DUF305 domain-containing protein n=1 Tax=Brevundimonas vesicularis TaxID=41276 RepID=UPI0028AA0796|nr:DUF305 domain-containing protein [Brevundimonas vesicularis]
MSIKLNAGLATAALSVLLTACSPAGQADRTETADAGSATEQSAPAAQPMAGPETPYSASEQQMHHAMMQAHGADPQETYALKMIEHHRGAIAMSEVLMRENPDAALRQMAEKTITMQRQEITELEQWVAQHRSSATAPAAGSVQPGA